MSFKDKKSGYKEVAEVKIASIVCQGATAGESPMYQFYGQPQTKNMNTDFNDRLIKIMNKAISDLRGKGYNAAFVSSSVDGVSCDSKFVQERFLSFLRGDINDSAHTDTNHNAKNGR